MADTKMLVAVKPLEWRNECIENAECWIADSKEGRFAYGSDFNGNAYWQSSDGEHEALSMDAAKAAAQADYDARIRSALAEPLASHEARIAELEGALRVAKMAIEAICAAAPPDTELQIMHALTIIDARQQIDRALHTEGE